MTLAYLVAALMVAPPFSPTSLPTDPSNGSIDPSSPTPAPAPIVDPQDPVGVHPDALDRSCKPVMFAIPIHNSGMLLDRVGEDDIGEGERTVKVDLELEPTHRDVILTGKVAMGSGTDTESFGRIFHHRIPVAPEGCKIVSLDRAATHVQATAAAGARNALLAKAGPANKGVVENIRCTLGEQGSDDGKLACLWTPLIIRATLAEEDETPDCSKVRLGGKLEYPRLSTTRADTDMGDKRSISLAIESGATVSADRKRVNLRARLKATENAGGAQFQGMATRVVFDADRDAPGCRILRLSSATGRVSARVRTRGYNTDRFSPGAVRAGTFRPRFDGHLRRAYCRTNVPGDDDGKLHCAEVEYDNIVVELTP